MFMCSSRNKFTLLYQNSETYVFVGFRPPYVGAHPGGHLHGVSKQISIFLGKIFLRLSRIRGEALVYVARSKSTTRRDHIFLTNSYGFILN